MSAIFAVHRPVAYAEGIMTADQAYTSATPAKVNLDTANLAAVGIVHDTTNKRFTVPWTGRYLANAAMQLSGVTAGQYIVGSFYVNGSLRVRAGRTDALASTMGFVSGSRVLALTAADYVEFFAEAGASGTIVSAYSSMNLVYIGK